MRICYLRGVELKKKIKQVAEDDGELPGNIGEPKVKAKQVAEDDDESLEHILPNALGGTIKSKNILSHKANQDLNDAIDKHFAKIFELFTLRLGIDKDRKTSPQGVLAFHENYQRDVVFKGGRFYPKTPFYDPEEKIIYAGSQKIGENYRTHLLSKNVISENDDVAICDDVAGNIHIPFQLDNTIFKKGIAKIAAGYASFNGIPRANLRDVINLSGNEFWDQLAIAPSVPLTTTHSIFEAEIYRSKHYPAHILMLYGSKKERFLYCYVELFSTFQYYILLDQDYGGEDIRRQYVYDLMNAEEIDWAAYIKSVPDIPVLGGQLENYKEISQHTFLMLARINRDVLKHYNHLKFNSLFAFTNYISTKRKLES